MLSLCRPGLAGLSLLMNRSCCALNALCCASARPSPTLAGCLYLPPHVPVRKAGAVCFLLVQVHRRVQPQLQQMNLDPASKFSVVALDHPLGAYSWLDVETDTE
jgi:hypothetical protein